MVTIDEMRAALLRESREREIIRDRPKVYGRFGEIVVEAWLRERQHLEVLPFPQTPETKSDYLEGFGKRPDFMVCVPPQDGSGADTLVLMDAKFHTLDSSERFWIGASEMRLYDSAMAEWQAIWLFFAVIDARAPNALHFVERREMVLNADLDQWEYRLNSIPDRCELISQEDLARAVDRLAREGYDNSLLPFGFRSASE
ncbi:hypothetical protein [Sphingobium yanoikuyae]|mgnify:CR=1 FL=1|uniref:hypothetical protein n=1 Tax=Sphingobium yanoikuyae TaxID=13690 RepID=UPI0028AD12F3|nr:hypothetical protein [Sphingobium yanoikuyae]